MEKFDDDALCSDTKKNGSKEKLFERKFNEQNCKRADLIAAAAAAAKQTIFEIKIELNV